MATLAQVAQDRVGEEPLPRYTGEPPRLLFVPLREAFVAEGSGY